MTEKKTLSQQYYEEAEALKANGTSNAEAIRQVAKKHGKKENAVRGGINQYKTKHLDGGAATGSRRGRRKPTSVDDLLGDARAKVEAAIALIDQEVEEAESALGEAQARSDEVTKSVDNRRADLKQKLAALK